MEKYHNPWATEEESIFIAFVDEQLYRGDQVFSIQHYVINVVSSLRQVGGFLWVLPFTSTNKTDCHDITHPPDISL